MILGEREKWTPTIIDLEPGKVSTAETERERERRRREGERREKRRKMRENGIQILPELKLQICGANDVTEEKEARPVSFDGQPFR